MDLAVVGEGEGQFGQWQSEQTSRLSGGSHALPQAASTAHQLRRLLGRRDTDAESTSSSTPASQAPLYSLLGAPAPPQAAPALRLEPGSRELLLARPLDKEGAEGESGLVVRVRCRPRQRQAPATTIPIRLIVTDANDHAPEFVGEQPYVIRISETAPAGTPLGAARDLQALDRDSAGPHSTIHYRVLEQSGAPLPDRLAGAAELQAADFANLSRHFAFTNPLEPQLWLISALDYEALPAPAFLITIAAQDQAEPEPLQSTVQVQINVLGKFRLTATLACPMAATDGYRASCIRMKFCMKSGPSLALTSAFALLSLP